MSSLALLSLASEARLSESRLLASTEWSVRYSVQYSVRE